MEKLNAEGTKIFKEVANGKVLKISSRLLRIVCILILAGNVVLNKIYPWIL
jgi:hypothetical protein